MGRKASPFTLRHAVDGTVGERRVTKDRVVETGSVIARIEVDQRPIAARGIAMSVAIGWVRWPRPTRLQTDDQREPHERRAKSGFREPMAYLQLITE